MALLIETPSNLEGVMTEADSTGEGETSTSKWKMYCGLLVLPVNIQVWSRREGGLRSVSS